MTVAPSLLPTMVSIPGGVFNGMVMDSFRLGQYPVTNAEYNAHVDQYSSRPFVLLHANPETHETSILCRAKTPEEAIGDLAKSLPKNRDTRDPFMFGALTLFELKKDMSPKGFDRPRQPVVNVSWFHAFEYCVSNGFFLPTDDQWIYAAGVHEGREHATSTGKLYGADGKTKLAHFNENATCDVDDPRYPKGPHGLGHMTGEVWEWTDRNASQKWAFGQRGGSWYYGVPKFLQVAFRNDFVPVMRLNFVGFRVGAPATEAGLPT